MEVWTIIWILDGLKFELCYYSMKLHGIKGHKISDCSMNGVHPKSLDMLSECAYFKDVYFPNMS
jgi:hypothetical protein